MFKERNYFSVNYQAAMNLHKVWKVRGATMLGDTEIWLQKSHGSILFRDAAFTFPQASKTTTEPF